jgi:hypothetical protein
MNFQNVIARSSKNCTLGEDKCKRSVYSQTGYWRSSRNWISVCIVFGAATILATGTVHAADAYRQALLDPLREIEKGIQQWQKVGSWALSATIAIGIIGLVITVIQAVSSLWIKIVTAVLGFISGSLVLVNQNCFDADHRAYRSLAKRSQELVSNFKMQLSHLAPDPLIPLTRDQFEDLYKQLIKLREDIGNLDKATFGKNAVPPATPIASLSLSLISSAYAMEGANDMPGWTKVVPSDTDNIYFVGVGNDRTAAAARDTAQKQAKAAVESSFETALHSYSKIPADDVAHLAHEISGFGEVVSTFVVPTAGAYRGYALVRVSRALIALSAKGFFLAHHLSFDPKLLDQIAAGDKTRIAAATEANEQKTAAQTGVVYIQIANEKDRGVGEALRKDLSSVISAPGVQVAVSQPANTVRYFNAEDAALAQIVRDRAQKYLAAEGYPTELQIENPSGTSLKGQNKRIEVWLAEMQQLKPRVYVEVDNGTPPDKLQTLKGQLEQNGYEVHLEKPSDVPNQEARILYYRDSDATEAEVLLKQLPELGVLSSRDMPTKIKGTSDARPRHFDLRIGKNTFVDKH